MPDQEGRSSLQRTPGLSLSADGEGDKFSTSAGNGPPTTVITASPRIAAPLHRVSAGRRALRSCHLAVSEPGGQNGRGCLPHREPTTLNYTKLPDGGHRTVQARWEAPRCRTGAVGLAVGPHIHTRRRFLHALRQTRCAGKVAAYSHQPPPTVNARGAHQPRDLFASKTDVRPVLCKVRCAHTQRPVRPVLVLSMSVLVGRWTGVTTTFEPFFRSS